MTRSAILALALLACAAPAVSANAEEPVAEVAPTPKSTPTAEEAEAQRKFHEELKEREKLLQESRSAIVGQLADLATNPDAHPAWAREWAGEYFCGDGMGCNVRITLGPEGDLVYTWNGCMGLYDSQIAKVREVRDDRLVLDLERPADDPQGMRFLDEEIALVRWGERRYLVPMGKLEGFCNAVNTGREGARPALMHPLRSESRVSARKAAPLTPADGLPEVPEEGRGWLLREPVEATVTDVSNFHANQNPGQTWMEVAADVTLDAGAAEGLRRGMELSGADDATRWSRIRLVDIADHESRATFSMTVYSKDGYSTDFLRTGMRCSTRQKWGGP